MILLIFTSLLWAFSFGLIKGGLTGLPPAAVAFLRLAVAGAVFLPFLRVRGIRKADAARLLATGAIQYGLMYVVYTYAFQYLQAHEVALFTVFTPIYVAAFNDLLERRFCIRTLLAALLAVIGGGIIKYKQLDSSSLWIGFLLMQGANLSFAFGQIFYRRTMDQLSKKRNDLQVFGLLYIGAAVTAALFTLGTKWQDLSFTIPQIGILLYLGAIASGLGFFLWNAGARQVSAGTLAVFNNLKIPLGILVSVLVFGESADWPRLLAGGTVLVAALAVNCMKRTV